MPAEEGERDRHPLPPPADRVVSEAVRVAGLSERPDHSRRSGCGDQRTRQREGARLIPGHPTGRLRVQLRRDLQKGASRGL